MSAHIPLPTLYVEGKDDISVINALLLRHGLDTGQGKRHLQIKDNGKILENDNQWTRFRDVDRIKSEIHTWLAWQQTPGSPLGTAINARILRHDSPQAIAFLRWLRDLHGFSQLAAL